MTKQTWIEQRRWLLGGAVLTVLTLVSIAVLWAVQAQQYQLALTHYNATHKPFTSSSTPTDIATTGTLMLPGQPPVDASGPDTWGVAGWTIRLLAIFLPLLFGIALDWRERHQRLLRLHQTHAGQATTKLAEAITANPELPEKVLDAYSKLRELEP